MRKNLMGLMAGVVIGFIGLVLHPGCKKTDLEGNPLANTRWVLESIVYANQGTVNIEKTFGIWFKEDLTLEMQVDCNVCTGLYSPGPDHSIQFIDHSGCTEIFCGPGSRDDEFHDALDGAFRYEINGNRLRVYFNDQGSRLNFTAGWFVL